MPAKKAAKRSKTKAAPKPRTPRAPVAAEHRIARSELERIAERVFRCSQADETEVSIDATTDALTRFANNTIHQNVAEREVSVSVRAAVDGRTARVSTNKTDNESLARAVRAAEKLARLQPRNENLLPMLGRQKYLPVKRFFPATAAATPEDRARAVVRVVDLANERGQTAAGIFTAGLSQTALANSHGLFAYYEQTRAEFSVTFLEGGSSGWAKANFSDIQLIDADALAERASRKASDAREPREIPAGHYTVILEPAAVLDLVGFLFYDFAATAMEDQRSCFTDRLGKQLLGRHITIWDDVYHPLQTGAPFDGEGVPREKVLLVDRGVPKSLVYSRASAKKRKAKPTGHGLPLPNEWGEAPLNIVFAGGKESVEEMIASTGQGILVTRFWYIREVDPYQKILTGMTRDGTFLVENGRVAGPLKNFRFNQSIIEMMASVEALGAPVRAAGEESFEMVVPAMKVRNFHFTEMTKF
ncbi:MAG TPA: TldD/PmbA family protein [Candidatus Dormibacteraeota bacterium]|nr:TldD/PmbA family protein [Candidatus Dormibacteraeota bacterium]